MDEEFEKWKKTDQGEMFKSVALISDSNMYLIFSAGQKAEADKHRWIPITERLPEEKDGSIHFSGTNIYPYNQYIFILARIAFMQNTQILMFNLYDKKFEGIDIDCITSWQPLPE